MLKCSILSSELIKMSFRSLSLCSRESYFDIIIHLKFPLTSPPALSYAFGRTPFVRFQFFFSNKKDDTMDFFNAMLLDLAPVVSWMANALEMLHYLQCNLNRYLQHNSGTSSGIRDSLASADEELLTVLEEVIMFTFQQTVYHLTKVIKTLCRLIARPVVCLRDKSRTIRTHSGVEQEQKEGPFAAL